MFNLELTLDEKKRNKNNLKQRVHNIWNTDTIKTLKKKMAQSLLSIITESVRLVFRGTLPVPREDQRTSSSTVLHRREPSP